MRPSSRRSSSRAPSRPRPSFYTSPQAFAVRISYGRLKRLQYECFVRAREPHAVRGRQLAQLRALHARELEQLKADFDKQLRRQVNPSHPAVVSAVSFVMTC
jgi:hypothetical protein